MVVFLAREPRQVVDHNERDASLPFATERQQALQLSPISGSSAFALLDESLDDLKPLACAVVVAGAELRWQTEVFGLLLRAHPNVDDGTDHGRAV